MTKDRAQTLNPRTDMWVKVDTTTGLIIGMKKDGKPYKNIQTVDEYLGLCPDKRISGKRLAGEQE